MDSNELKSKLTQLLVLKSENEIVEFKEANNNYDFAKLGKYFSALSNEANLLGKECAWLVFGIEDKFHRIVGTKYRENRTDLDKLKREIEDRTSNRITFLTSFCRKCSIERYTGRNLSQSVFSGGHEKSGYD